MAAPVSWRRNQFAVTAASFIGFTGFTLVMPFLPLYINHLGVHDVGETALWAGLSLGVTPAVTAAMSPLWGRVADRFGRKLMVERSLASFVVVMCLMAYVTRPWQIFALRAVQGLFAGYAGLTIAMAAESAPRDKLATAIGLVQTSQRLGPALGPVIGGIVAGVVGLRQAFFVTAAFYAIAFLLVLVLYRDPHHGDASPESGAGSPLRVRDLLKAPGFALAMTVIFGMTFVDRSFGPVLPLYVQSLGIGADRISIVSGILFSATAIGGAFGNQLCDALLRRRPARLVIAGASVLAGVSLSLFLATSPALILTVALAVFGAGIGAATTAAYTVGGRPIPAGSHGTGFGILSGASLAGLALSPVASGLLSHSSLISVFVLDILLLAAIAAIVWWTLADGPESPGGR